MAVRRVVTAQGGDGPASFTTDAPVEATTFSGSGHSFYQLWGSDEARVLPDDGAEPAHPAPLPPVGGFRFGIFVVSPEPTGEAPGVHATDTTDLIVVLSGEVVIELDSGETRTLRTGDTLIQNGTAHRWINHGTDFARLAVFNVGAERRP